MSLKTISAVCLLLLAVVATLYFYFFETHVLANPPENGELVNASLAVGGRQRSFAYYLPEQLDSQPALLFVLHGSGRSGARMREITAYGFDRIADAEGGIAVYPDGYQNHWNDCRASAGYAANTDNIDDPAFFREMLDYFERRFGIDRTRVFATGFSNGGHMVYRLAFEMPGQFAALAAIAANLPVRENLDCRPSGEPVSVAIFNGTEDPINPYHGGLVEIRGDASRGVVLSSMDSATYWAQLASAGEGETLELQDTDGDSDTGVTVTRWRGSLGHQVRLYALRGSGHVVPSKSTRFASLLGGDARDIEAAEEIWAFFSEVSQAPVDTP